MKKKPKLCSKNAGKAQIPLYHKETGWKDWSKAAQENDVLEWFTERVQLFEFLKRSIFTRGKHPDDLHVRHNMPVKGSTPNESQILAL